jgi:hypothetical protein
MPIETTQDLHDHLELAISIELATVPPYLYAMYSIEDLDSPHFGVVFTSLDYGCQGARDRRRQLHLSRGQCHLRVLDLRAEVPRDHTRPDSIRPPVSIQIGVSSNASLRHLTPDRVPPAGWGGAVTRLAQIPRIGRIHPFLLNNRCDDQMDRYRSWDI